MMLTESFAILCGFSFNQIYDPITKFSSTVSLRLLTLVNIVWYSDQWRCHKANMPFLWYENFLTGTIVGYPPSFKGADLKIFGCGCAMDWL